MVTSLALPGRCDEDRHCQRVDLPHNQSKAIEINEHTMLQQAHGSANVLQTTHEAIAKRARALGIGGPRLVENDNKKPR
jgi:hypothetical protein